MSELEDTDLPYGFFVVDPALKVTSPAQGIEPDLHTVRIGGTLLDEGAAPGVLRGCDDYVGYIGFRGGDTLPRGQQERWGINPISMAYVYFPCSVTDFTWMRDLAVGDYTAFVYGYRGASTLPSSTLPVVRQIAVR